MNYGSVWVDLQGTTVLPEEVQILQHPNTGGVLLFTKNYASVQQLKSLVASIRQHAGKPVLISVDHEGGRKWRFEEGFWKPIAPQEYGFMYEKDPQQAIRDLHYAGRVVAHELLNCGVDLTFAPVLDIDTGVSTVIGDRSYSSNPEIATACARAFIAGMRKEGMASVGKHYPGHGGCVMDSHFTAAIDTRSLAELEALDLVPFIKLKNELTGVMPAHVVYSAVDPLPAGFSKLWLQDILRQKIGFNGAVISDCLSMHGSGFTDKIADGAMLALQAGCDMVIASQQTRADLLKVLNGIKWQTNDVQQQRIHKLAGNFAAHTQRMTPAELAST